MSTGKPASLWQYLRRPSAALRELRYRREGRRSQRRLLAGIPQLAEYANLAARLRPQIEPHYRRYVGGVSTPEMAASLQLSMLLRGLCEIRRPQRIVDLGSGFSSMVLRSYAAAAGLPASSVWSVDDSPQWLDMTRQFLESCSLSSDNLVPWDDFLGARPAPFDFILHDLGSMKLRQETLVRVLSLASPDGWVVLDDVHKKRYGAYARRTLTEAGFVRYSLRQFVGDDLGRFAILAMRAPA